MPSGLRSGVCDEGRGHPEAPRGLSGQQSTSDEGRDRPEALRRVSGQSHRGTLAGQLAAMGFTDTATTERRLAGLGFGRSGHSEDDGPLLSAVAAAADPDQALAALTRMAPDKDLFAALRADQIGRAHV